jgi:hypothetical protein
MAGETKERSMKRVPLHRDLITVLERKVVLLQGHLFLKDGKSISRNNVRWPWDLAVKAAGLDTRLQFRDLRHTLEGECKTLRDQRSHCRGDTWTC